MKKKAYLILALMILPLILSGCMATMAKVAEMGNMQDLSEGIQIVDKVIDATKDFTPEEEYYIGRAAAATILGKYPLYDKNTELIKYINKIGQSLVLNSPRPYLYKGYYFLLLDDDTQVNAYATPGGHILITTGLLNLCENEDELAAVLAHEIAHIANKDALEAISDTKKMEAINSILKFGVRKLGEEYAKEELDMIMGAFDDISGTVSEAIMNGYSVDQEDSADKLALKILEDCGYAQSSIKTIINKLPVELTGHYKSHRPPAERIVIVDKLLAQNVLINEMLPQRAERFAQMME